MKTNIKSLSYRLVTEALLYLSSVKNSNFVDIQRGMSADQVMLTRALSVIVDQGFAKKDVVKSGRVSYCLTEKGKRITKLAIEINKI